MICELNGNTPRASPIETGAGMGQAGAQGSNAMAQAGTIDVNRFIEDRKVGAFRGLPITVRLVTIKAGGTVA